MISKIEYKNINQIAYPILLNYLLTSVFELLDKAIVGHYSIQGFAVVGAAASSIYAITGALGILSAAFHIIAADEKGKQNEQGFEATFAISKNLALSIGIGFFILSLLGGQFFFQKLYDIHGDELSELLSYFYPAAFTVTQNMLMFQYSSYFRSCLNTKITLYSTIVSTGVNLFFDFSLVYGFCGLPKLGTAGAAWGSVIGLFAGLLVYQLAYYKKHSLSHIKKQMRNFNARLSIIKRIFSLYPSLLGQEMLESSIFILIVSAVIARLGTEQMAIYSLLDTVGSMIGLPIYAYAAATQTFALQNYYAQNKTAVKNYLRSGMILTFGMILTLCILCRLFQTEILHWIVTDVEIITKSQKLLYFVFVIQLIKIPYQIYMSYLQGIRKERFVFVCTALRMIAASAGIVIMGSCIGLPGVYLIMILEFLILSWVYIKSSGI